MWNGMYNMMEMGKKFNLHKSGGRESDDLSFMADMQHFGWGTCLIDFTRDRMAALLFACQDAGRPGKVIIIDGEDGSKFRRVGESEEERNAVFKKLMRLESDRRAYLWRPANENQRVGAQQSEFLISHLGYFESETEEFVIEPEEKTCVIVALKSMEISVETMFPDIYGIGKDQGACKEFEKVSPVQYLKNGKRHLNEGDFDQAIKSFEKCRRANSNNDENMAEAIIRMSEAKIKDVKRGEFFAYDMQEMMDDLQKALQINSDRQDECYYWMGKTVKIAQGDNAVAESYFQQAVNSNSKNSAAHYEFGVCALNAGKYTLAIESFNKALDLYPYYVDAIRDRGEANMKEGKWEEAKRDFLQSIKAGEHSAEIYRWLFIVHGTLGDQVGAKSALNKCFSEFPEDPVIQNWKREIFRNPDEAQDATDNNNND